MSEHLNQIALQNKISELENKINGLMMELFLREIEPMNIDTECVENFMHNGYKVDLDYQTNIENLLTSLLI